MAKPVTILIADDHELIRGGLRTVLQSNTPYHVIEAGNGMDALRMIREKKLDVAILDIEMPGMSGYDIAKKVREERLSVKIIFLTMFKDESMFNKAMDIGVKGYVLKENTVTEILNSLKAVMDGRYYLSPAISDFLMRRNTNTQTKAASGALDQLTSAELTVLNQLAEMKTSQEIAESLHISVKTVQNHRNNICSKLGLNGSHALLKYALENKK